MSDTETGHVPVTQHLRSSPPSALLLFSILYKRVIRPRTFLLGHPSALKQSNVNDIAAEPRFVEDFEAMPDGVQKDVWYVFLFVAGPGLTVS